MLIGCLEVNNKVFRSLFNGLFLTFKARRQRCVVVLDAAPSSALATALVRCGGTHGGAVSLRPLLQLFEESGEELTGILLYAWVDRLPSDVAEGGDEDRRVDPPSLRFL